MGSFISKQAGAQAPGSKDASGRVIAVSPAPQRKQEAAPATTQPSSEAPAAQPANVKDAPAATQDIPTTDLQEVEGAFVEEIPHQEVGNAILDELFPAIILNPKQELVATVALTGKYIGFYFAAKWCATCGGFTPKLVEWLNDFKATHPRRDEFEIVFVSSDRSLEAFDEYHAATNFYALPYEYRQVKTTIAARFGIQGLPTLVIVDPNGHVISTSGRKLISEDKTGQNFPWAPKPIQQLLQTQFRNAKGDQVASTALEGKYIGLYFSAQWCPKCRACTPTLKRIYESLRKQDKPFEIIYVSSDHDQESLDEYFEELPWLTFDEPIFSTNRRADLAELYKVKGLPTFVMLTPELKLITVDARTAIEADLAGADFPWLPKPFMPLNESTVSVINEAPFLLINTARDVSKAAFALGPAAQAEMMNPVLKLKFFYVDSSKIYDLVKKAAKLDASQNLVIIDLTTSVKYVSGDQSLSPQSVTHFVSMYFEESLEAIDLEDQEASS